MSNDNGRNVFFIGSGTIEKMKNCTLTAIYDILLDEAIFWPSESERKVINKAFFSQYGLPNVTIILDGTLLGLANKPQREDT